MNRTFTPAATIVVALVLFLFTNVARAQDDNKPSPAVHAGLAFSSHVEDIGVMVGAYVPVVDKIKAGGDFTYYFTDDVGAANFTLWTINLNARYAIIDMIDVFAGLNILRWKGEYDFGFGFQKNQGFSSSLSATDIGINAGGIIEYPIGGFNVFGKANVVLGGDSSGLVVGGGLSKSF